MPRVLDHLLARLEQCFIHSGEIHPCRTFCPTNRTTSASSPRQPVLTGLAFGGQPSGVLIVWVVIGSGVGDGGQAGQVHGRQCGSNHQYTCEFGHGYLPIDQLALWG